jgi:predicted dehydrogenase
MATGAIAVAFAADLAQTTTGRVAAVGSRQAETADAFGDRFDVPNRHGSYEALVADPEVDVVYVATPAPMHLDGARLALRAGKPVLVEKPFTTNAADARELVALARDAGLFAMEAMWTRFLPHIVDIRRLLAEGALGSIVTVCADHGQHIEGHGHRLFAPELGGGALLDLGIYPVSFASMVLGTPERTISLATPAFGGVDGQTSMLFGYGTGAHALLTCTLSAKSPTRAAIVGTDARIEIEGDFYKPSSFTLIPRDGEPLHFEGGHRDSGLPGSGLYYQAVEVARCLDEGLLESPIMPLDESVSIMQTMDAVRAAAAAA